MVVVMYRGTQPERYKRLTGNGGVSLVAAQDSGRDSGPSPESKPRWSAPRRRHRLGHLPLLLLAVPVADLVAAWLVEPASECRIMMALDAGSVLASCAPSLWNGDLRRIRLAGHPPPSLSYPACLAEFRAAAGAAVALRMEVWGAQEIEIIPFGSSGMGRMRIDGAIHSPPEPPAGGYCPPAIG